MRRGAWLATPGSLATTLAADVRLGVLPIGLAHRDRVLVHHGTGSAMARVHLLQTERAEAGEHDVQLRLEAPLHLMTGDLVVLRRPSPSATVAGGEVVDPRPPVHRRFTDRVARHFADRLAGGADRVLSHLAGLYPLPAEFAELTAWAGGPGPREELLRAAGDRVVTRTVGDQRLLWAAEGWSRLQSAVGDAIAARQRLDPERCWHGVEELRAGVAPAMPRPAWDAVIAEQVAAGALLRGGSAVAAPALVPPLPRALAGAAAELLAAYDRAAFHPPYDHPAAAACRDPAAGTRSLAALRERGWLLRLDDRLHLHRRHGEALVAAVVAATATDGTVDIAWMKATYGLTRRDAVPLLEWLDAVGVTRRVGDARIAGPVRAMPVPLLGDSDGGRPRPPSVFAGWYGRRCGLRPSKPRWGGNVPGGFDSDTVPPFSLRRKDP